MSTDSNQWLKDVADKNGPPMLDQEGYEAFLNGLNGIQVGVRDITQLSAKEIADVLETKATVDDLLPWVTAYNLCALPVLNHLQHP